MTPRIRLLALLLLAVCAFPSSAQQSGSLPASPAGIDSASESADKIIADAKSARELERKNKAEMSNLLMGGRFNQLIAKALSLPKREGRPWIFAALARKANWRYADGIIDLQDQKPQEALEDFRATAAGFAEAFSYFDGELIHVSSVNAQVELAHYWDVYGLSQFMLHDFAGAASSFQASLRTMDSVPAMHKWLVEKARPEAQRHLKVAQAAAAAGRSRPATPPSFDVAEIKADLMAEQIRRSGWARPRD